MIIGMFPMSGVRCCDPELLELGLTLPGFVDRNKTIAALPSLGLLTLAGMTPSRHELRLVEVPYAYPHAQLPQQLDLAVISCHSAQIAEAYALARHYRDLSVPTVIGGTHVTAEPEEAAQHCDAVVVGEGECTWPQVLEDAARGRLQPFYRAPGDGFDLRQAPLPAYELLDIRRYNRLTVQTSRGCPHRCEFCASSVLLTERYKQKPIAKVLAEIERICTLWRRPFIEFADDNSFVNRDYWYELLPRIKHYGMKWFAETDITIAEDGALLELMRASGCAQLLIGLESPVETGLHGLELRNNWKHKMHHRYLEAIRAIQSRGITVNGCFIVGLDGQTTEIFEQIPQFVRQSELYDVQVTIQTPFPGTPLYARLAREGRLLAPRDWRRCTLFDVNFTPALMSVAQLHTGFKGLVAELYSDEFTRWRRRRFRDTYHRRFQPGVLT